MKKKFILISFLIVSCSLLKADNKKLKVYILAGQSNMEGHAHVSTFPHIGMDPKTKPLLEMMLDKEGNHRVCDRVWISYLTAKKGERVVKEGKLTTGFGAVMKGPKIGPEYTFGLTLEKHYENPVLIIKAAWGGNSLYQNFRPPSAGKLLPNEVIKANLAKKGKAIDEWIEKNNKPAGARYREMIEHVKNLLADPKKICPAYDEKSGYEIAGFVWFQGWNDKVAKMIYPNREKPGGYDEYTRLLVHFIKDVRKDLNAPKMPFVIGVVGQGGVIDPENPSNKNAMKNYYFRLAQAAPAKLPEFKDNVIAVLTEKYWDNEIGDIGLRMMKVKAKGQDLKRDKSLTKEQQKEAKEAYRKTIVSDDELKLFEMATSNFEFHYYGSAKMFAQFGKAFAEALIKNEKE